jgi:hypothetical protein
MRLVEGKSSNLTICMPSSCKGNVSSKRKWPTNHEQRAMYIPEAEHAEDYYCQALALAEALGQRPLQAHCHCSLGTLYAKTGRQYGAMEQG